MAAASVRDVLAFHKLDRGMYDALVGLGTAPEVARNIVALFMWMELIGVDVINYLRRHPDQYLALRLAAEAEAILDCVRRDPPPGAHSGLAGIPLTASLINEPLDLGFFYRHRDAAARGIAQILDGVGRLIFDDYLHALLAEYEASLQVAEAEARNGHPRAALPVLPQELARPYSFRALPMPEDCRSMFVTFSKGSPPKREDIVEYFTQKWGTCVDKVMMEKTTMASGGMPTYGRIVFTSESFIGLVLNGKPLVKLTIKGRQLWARRYEQRKDAGFMV